jgi:hypothetical protein
MYTNRWRPLKNSSLISQGIVARFINRDRGIIELSRRKYYSEFHGTPRLQKFFDEQMQDWINNGVLKQTPYEELIYINPAHLVPKANGKMRLVTDMRVVNSYMRKIHFKMENTITVEELMKENDFAITCDLKYAYNHIPVHKSLHYLLGIGWKDKCYRFMGMPFGLRDAPRVFSLITRKVEREIREMWGVRVVIYLDDIKVLHHNEKDLERIGREIADYLQYLGWTVNLEKSHLIPIKQFTYLGWQLNSENMKIALTKERLKKCIQVTKKTYRQTYRCKQVSIRHLASIIGTLSDIL